MKCYLHNLNILDCFLSLRFFGLLSSSLLLFPQRFGRYVQQDTWRNGYRRWFPELLRRPSSEGCRSNPHFRRVIYRNTLHLYPVMANGIRTGDPRGFNKRRSSKFREGSRVRQTPEEGRSTYRPKRCGNNNNNKDEDNSSKNLNDKNQQASSQKFRQLILDCYLYLSCYI